MSDKNIWVVLEDSIQDGPTVSLFATRELADQYFNELVNGYIIDSITPVLRVNHFICERAEIRVFHEPVFSEYPE